MKPRDSKLVLLGFVCSIKYFMRHNSTSVYKNFTEELPYCEWSTNFSNSILLEK